MRWVLPTCLLTGLFGLAVMLGASRQDVPGVSIDKGRRLAAVLGCSGCHGRGLAGEKWDDDPAFGTLFTSNLSRVLPRYSDAAIERALRTGFRDDGSAMWGMPSTLFVHLSNRDMRDLIAFLRSVPPTGVDHPRPVMGPGARAEIAAGKWLSSPQEIARDARRPVADLGPAVARGRYLVRATCAECHGTDLTGHPAPMYRPDLKIAAAYDNTAFRRLMRTGKAIDGGERGLMSEVARGRYAHFTDSEIVAVHDYLKAHAARRD